MITLRVKYVSLLLCFVVVFAFSQNNFVTIRFDDLEFLEKGFKNTNFSFNINGVLIHPDTLSHQIPIVKKGFDTVRFSMFGDFNDCDLAFTKFRKNKAYIIRINPCSQYELLPEKDAKIGTVEFLSKSVNEDLSLEFCAESIVFNKQNSKKLIECIPSAMCRFSNKEIKIIENEEVLDSFRFHFLHGENIFVSLVDKRLSLKIKNQN